MRKLAFEAQVQVFTIVWVEDWRLNGNVGDIRFSKAEILSPNSSQDIGEALTGAPRPKLTSVHMT